MPRPPRFRFEHYFEYRFDSGKLEPASVANPDDQRRALCTIETLDLNRAGLCKSRTGIVKVVRQMLRSGSAAVVDDPDEWAYR